MTAPDDRVRLRILTINCWGLEGSEDRQQTLREAIAALDPDLIALQEIAMIEGRNQLEEILAGSSLHRFHQVDLLGRTPTAEATGSALASRWRPIRIEAISLAVEADPGGHECALAAQLALPGGLSILFVAVKPSWQLDAEPVRVGQAHRLLDFEQRLRTEAPSILAGDFDAVPGGESIRTLADGGFRDAWALAGDGGAGHTWTVRNPVAVPEIERHTRDPEHARRIDYVFLGPSTPVAAASVMSCEVVMTDPPVSDHYGVLADVEYQPP